MLFKLRVSRLGALRYRHDTVPMHRRRTTGHELPSAFMVHAIPWIAPSIMMCIHREGHSTVPTSFKFLLAGHGHPAVHLLQHPQRGAAPEVPLMQVKTCTERYIQQSGLDYTIFRLCGFMQARYPMA